MIQTVFNAQTVFLLNDAWDGKSAFRADFSLVRDLESSLTKRETRRPYSATLVSKLNFSLTLRDSDLTAVIGSLRALNTQPVIVPFWPAMGKWSARAGALIKGGLMIAWKADWSQFAIYAAGSEPLWPAANDFVAPALMGFIKPAEPEMLSPSAAKWQVDFTESSLSSFCLLPSSFVFVNGPTPSGYGAAPKLLPFDPDFKQVTEQISIEVKRDQIGFSRQQATTFYPHTTWRGQRATYTLLDDEPAKMLRFFLDIAAPGATFWATTWLQAARLSANVASGDTVLDVTDTNAVLVGDYISLFTSAGIARKVTAKTLTTITIDSAPGMGLAKSATSLFPLSLARLDKPAITLQWRKLEAATCEIQWSEVPPEEILPGNETLGTTIGKLNQRVVLFEFTRDFGNGTVSSWYFTSYEADLTWNGHTWSSAGDWECGDVSQTLNLENDSTQLTSFIFSGNPLVDEISLTNEAPLAVKIRFADFDGVTVTNVTTMFFGDCSSTSRQGSKITAKCKFGPALFETQLPRMMRGTMCNHLGGSNNDGSFLISAGCTLLKANWKFTGQVTSPVSVNFPYTLKLNTLAGAGTNAAAALAGTGIFANWFANGWVEWGAGAAIQRRLIIGSTTIAAGVISLTLHRYFNGVPNIGDVVTFYPGCDGVYTTCQAFDAGNNPTGKFNNYLNFGGEPFTPAANPSTTGQLNLGVQGAKK